MLERELAQPGSVVMHGFSQLIREAGDGVKKVLLSPNVSVSTSKSNPRKCSGFVMIMDSETRVNHHTVAERMCNGVSLYKVGKTDKRGLKPSRVKDKLSALSLECPKNPYRIYMEHERESLKVKPTDTRWDPHIEKNSSDCIMVLKHHDPLSRQDEFFLLVKAGAPVASRNLHNRCSSNGISVGTLYHSEEYAYLSQAGSINRNMIAALCSKVLGISLQNKVSVKPMLDGSEVEVVEPMLECEYNTLVSMKYLEEDCIAFYDRVYCSSALTRGAIVGMNPLNGYTLLSGANWEGDDAIVNWSNHHGDLFPIGYGKIPGFQPDAINLASIPESLREEVLPYIIWDGSLPYNLKAVSVPYRQNTHAMEASFRELGYEESWSKKTLEVVAGLVASMDETKDPVSISFALSMTDPAESEVVVPVTNPDILIPIINAHFASEDCSQAADLSSLFSRQIGHTPYLKLDRKLLVAVNEYNKERRPLPSDD